MLKVKTLLFFFHIIKDTLGTYNIMHINYIKFNIMGIACYDELKCFLGIALNCMHIVNH